MIKKKQLGQKRKGAKVAKLKFKCGDLIRFKWHSIADYEAEVLREKGGGFYLQITNWRGHAEQTVWRSVEFLNEFVYSISTPEAEGRTI